MPRRIVVVDEIPKGPTGKVQRIGLAERLGVRGKDTAGPPDRRPPYGFLENELVGIWRSVLGIPGLGVADDFFALGGDSILGAEAVARIRELVGDPDLPLTSIVRAPTPAAMAHEIFAGIGLGASGIVPLQASGTRTPLFLVHPGDGDVLAYPVLARLLGPDQPSYALRARGIDDDRATPSSLPELAAEYVEAVREVQPYGPYALGGFCLGGPIAAEMANQLAAAGEETAALILLDPRFPRPGGLRYSAWLAGRRARQGRLTAAVARRLGRRTVASPARDLGEKTGCHADLARIREGYRPRPADVPTTVVLSDGFEDPGQIGVTAGLLAEVACRRRHGATAEPSGDGGRQPSLSSARRRARRSSAHRPALGTEDLAGSGVVLARGGELVGHLRGGRSSPPGRSRRRGARAGTVAPPRPPPRTRRRDSGSNSCRA